MSEPVLRAGGWFIFLREEVNCMSLEWLPAREDWDERLRALKVASAASAGPLLRELAESRMEFAQLARLDRVAQKVFAMHASAPGGSVAGFAKVRLAVLASSTTAHLVPGIRVAGLRWGLEIEVFATEYAAYRQQLMDAGSELHAFRPQVVLLALDARHVVALGVSGAGGGGIPPMTMKPSWMGHPAPDASSGILDPTLRRGAKDGPPAATLGTHAPGNAVETLRGCWQMAKAAFACQVLQQTVLPVFPALMGNNEERLTGSPAAVVAAVNERLRGAADEDGVDLLALDRFAMQEGLAHWHDAGLWLHAKQEVHPRAAEMYGEQVARVVAAGLGRAKKCLVLDLDNTLWSGVVGDDGVEGIVLGQGSAAGEAFVEFQQYAKRLSERGVLLAVCSKNDEANAREPFARHPEMVLREEDVACFVANWSDKATNLRDIAGRLNIGLDALVFVDDNAAERELIRRELPMVAVPEMPECPAAFTGTLAAAGYFEALRLTVEDAARGELYRAEAERAALREAAGERKTDVAGYLRSLCMELTLAPVDEMSLGRVTQLMNKTNQFNLTTVRHTEAEVRAMMLDPARILLQARLRDRFGDNGMIAVMSARVRGSEGVIEEWLMSCRVLERRVEEACFNALVEVCRAHGVKRLVGIYKPTAKNALVRELYASLGFAAVGGEAEGESRWELPLAGFAPRAVPMDVQTAGRLVEHEALV